MAGNRQIYFFSKQISKVISNFQQNSRAVHTSTIYTHNRLHRKEVTEDRKIHTDTKKIYMEKANINGRTKPFKTYLQHTLVTN
jgi:deoxyadenosine/deoxycytidine kinase